MRDEFERFREAIGPVRRIRRLPGGFAGVTGARRDWKQLGSGAVVGACRWTGSLTEEVVRRRADDARDMLPADGFQHGDRERITPVGLAMLAQRVGIRSAISGQHRDTEDGRVVIRVLAVSFWGQAEGAAAVDLDDAVIRSGAAPRKTDSCIALAIIRATHAAVTPLLGSPSWLRATP